MRSTATLALSLCWYTVLTYACLHVMQTDVNNYFRELYNFCNFPAPTPIWRFSKFDFGSGDILSFAAMLGVWKGSALHKRLVPLAERLGGKISDRFAGLVVGGNSVLYRHAQYYVMYKKGRPYERLNWGKPFGGVAAHRLVNYVLLHATKPDEIFFLIPITKARTLSREFPQNINIGVDPKTQSSMRDKIEPYRMRITAIRELLHT